MSSCENPNTDKDVLMTRRQKFDGKTKTCVKCKEKLGSIVVRYAVYCKSCFFPLVQTRFRKVLEPTVNPVPDGPRRKALKAEGSLLIGLSGGTSSTTLLDLVAKTYYAPLNNEHSQRNEKVKGGKEHPRNSERVWKGRPTVCYVEVCGAFSGALDRTEDVRRLVEQYSGFDFLPLRLEDAFDPRWWPSTEGKDLLSSVRSIGLDMTHEDLNLIYASPETSPLVSLKTYMTSLPTKTAFFSAIQLLTRVLLLHTAASRQASHIVLGTSLTSLSVNLISGIAQGGGFSIPEESKEEWAPRQNPEKRIRIIRPLRDIGMKECAIWNWWNGVPTVGKSNHMYVGGYGSGKNAIGALTRDFIFGLETDYPATVSTIARTCAKLAPKEGSNGICILCERPSQQNVQRWKAQISIRSYSDASPAVSGSTRPPHLTEEEISVLTKPAPSIGFRSTSVGSLTPGLCYACHTLLTSRSSRAVVAPLPEGQTLNNIALPTWTRSALQYLEQTQPTRKLNQSEMKNEISDFLLPE